jgi:hypothetical protein
MTSPMLTGRIGGSDRMTHHCPPTIESAILLPAFANHISAQSIVYSPLRKLVPMMSPCSLPLPRRVSAGFYLLIIITHTHTHTRARALTRDHPPLVTSQDAEVP